MAKCRAGAPRHGGAALLLAAALFATLGPAGLRAAPLDDVFAEDKNWVEAPPDLPDAVHDDALVGFYVSPNTSFRFALDSKSITLGKDGVAHYVIVGTSDQGARNVSFQGMRCATREFKTYAYGRADGAWSQSRNQTWARVGEADGNRELAALYKDIFCPDGFPLNLKQVEKRLRTNPYASLPQ